jgi:hypothetical protein
MSWYTAASRLAESAGDGDWWKTTYSPSDEVPVSGIYRCLGCNREITSNKPDRFPPQNHYQHTAQQGAIRWKLNVRTNTKGE